MRIYLITAIKKDGVPTSGVIWGARAAARRKLTETIQALHEKDVSITDIKRIR